VTALPTPTTPRSAARRVTIRVAIAAAVIVVLWIGLSYQVVQNPSVVEHPSPADAIVVLGPATNDRIAEAVALARQNVSHVIVVSAHRWSNLVVVTSRYHISRARLIFKRCFTGRLQMVAAPENINPAQWLYQYFYQSAGYLRAAVQTGC
jgi:uncharacterized SAM-binding protein YcdF (DUF218 family)